MIKRILINSCLELKRRLVLARQSIEGRQFPDEVQLCYEWVQQTLGRIERQLDYLSSLLELDLEDRILNQTWYSELSILSSELEVLDQYYLHPLYRLGKDDVLALKVIEWLHRSHPQTVDKPFIISNGSFSIAASRTTPTLYWLPVTSQLSFLHLALFFHEFGHELFLHHKEEMEDLIAEFQEKLAEFLKPAVSQSDDRYQGYLEKAADIVETWREWMEELFCDVVGLTIGGKSYLQAFSHFIRMGGIKEFYVPERQLSKRSHPVSLLRIRFLAERAAEIGLQTEAARLEEEWQSLAGLLDAREDYYGYFDEAFKHQITAVLDDMLTEANPKKFTDLISATGSPAINYLQLINEAWDHFQDDPQNYAAGERQQIERILAEKNT